MTDKQELATVHRLPVDAEIVTEEQWREKQHRDAARARRGGYLNDVATITRATRKVATHPHTVATSKTIARHSWYVVAGAWTTITLGRHDRQRPRRMARQAELEGNTEELKYWFEADEQARDRRHKRLMNYINTPLEWLRAFLLSAIVGSGLLLALGIVVACYRHDWTWVFAPLIAAGAAIAFLVTIVTFLWAVLPAAFLACLIVACWHRGRKASVTPDWMSRHPAMEDDALTHTRVVAAFRDLGIPELRKRIEANPDPAYLVSAIRIAGCGDEFEFTPPSGATESAELLRRQARLAENLARMPHEVHLSIPAAGKVRVWAARTGALDEPTDPSPLVLDPEMTADYRRGRAPWGQSLRGDPVTVSLFQIHLLMTGQSAQGKTSSLRALALWLALDKRVEFRIADLKGMNDKTKRSDWAMFEPIARRFIAGPSDDHVIAATEMLEQVAAEMDRRLTEGGEWNPLIAIVDEAQVAYMCPEKDDAGRPYGGKANTSRFLTAVRKIQNQGRVVDVLLWQGTQDPTDQNLPVLAREGAHLRMCLAVGKETKSRMALGDAAVDNGAAPHALRINRDRGTVVAAGGGIPLEDDETSMTIRTHYIPDAEAEEIASRALELRGPAPVWADAEVVRDVLADVADCFGHDDQVNAKDMTGRLRKLVPDYVPYRHLKGTELAVQLREQGVSVTPIKGYLTVVRDRVWKVLNERE